MPRHLVQCAQTTLSKESLDSPYSRAIVRAPGEAGASKSGRYIHISQQTFFSPRFLLEENLLLEQGLDLYRHRGELC